jgi:SAM-dependent methyltransferase
VVCAACGSGLTLPLADQARVMTYYPATYNAYGLPEDPVLRVLATLLARWRYWRALHRFPLNALLQRPAGRLLDVGGGRGDLGVALREHGWQVTSLDPSQAACAAAGARGVTSICGSLSDSHLALGDRYDAVVFQHSLEHVIDPHRDLQAAHARLAAGGMLIVTVPNFACWQRRAFRADWFHLDLPRHRSHFTRAGIDRLMQRCGFVLTAARTSTSSDGLVASVAYRWRGHYPETAAGGSLQAAIGILTAPAVALLNRLAGGGDVLHAHAAKLG